MNVIKKLISMRISLVLVKSGLNERQSAHLFFVVVLFFLGIVFGLSMDCLCEMVYLKKVF